MKMREMWDLPTFPALNSYYFSLAIYKMPPMQRKIYLHIRGMLYLIKQFSFALDWLQSPATF